MQRAKRSSNGGVRGGGGGGPCGACKFLRRKCVKGCVFAPYFDSEQGPAQFAAVHKVFGASNASKLLLRLPPYRRADAVVTLCYEAIARVRDPVYGCVAHIFTLQQQVVQLQSELAYVQARLSTIQTLIPPSASARNPLPSLPAGMASVLDDNLPSDPNLPLLFDPPEMLQKALGETAALSDPISEAQQLADAQLQAVAWELVSRYLPGVRIEPPASCESP